MKALYATRFSIVLSIFLFTASSHAGSDERPDLSAQHHVLARLAGEYTLTSRFWHSTGAEPEFSHLPARRLLILDGRVLRLEVGPDAGGFLGAGLMGYDAATERYWYTWADTTTTGRASLEGSLDEQGTGQLEGTTPSPGGPRPLRVEIERDGAAEIHRYFDPSRDRQHPWLELRYEPVGAVEGQ